MARLSFLTCFLVLCLSLLIIPGRGYRPLPKKHVALFIFGDSQFDAGNNNYINTTAEFRGNFYPYGESFFKYPTGRPSDGRLVPDFIAEYAKLPLISTFLPSYSDKFIYGVNFASGGAGALVETYQGFAIDLKTQLSYFKIVEKQLKPKLGDARTKKLLSEAVYLFNIGSNDYFFLLSTNSSVLQSSNATQEYIGMVIGNLTTTIKEIYKMGGRKFGLVGLGALGCTPSLRALVPESLGSCLEIASDLAKLHNVQLYKVLHELESQLPGFKYAIYDLFTTATEVFNNPSRYGFKEVATACCGSGPYRGILNCGGMTEIKEYELCDNPKEHLFFDAVHPSEKGYKLIAELNVERTPECHRALQSEEAI